VNQMVPGSIGGGRRTRGAGRQVTALRQRGRTWVDPIVSARNPAGRVWWALLVCALVAGSRPAVAAPPTVPPVLTRAKDVLALAAGDDMTPRQVRLTGVVTAYDSVWDAFFVQDSTGGVRVVPPAGRRDLHLGDVIVVDGIFRHRDLAPAVLPKQIRVVGRAPLPVPLRPPPSQIVSGMCDSQWVELGGIVRTVLMRKNHAVAEIASGDERVNVHLHMPDQRPLPEYLVDSNIRVRGVCSARFNAAHEFIGAVIFVPDLTLLTLDKAAPQAPWETPVVALSSVLTRRRAESLGHRIRVRGVVELFRPGQGLFITDGGKHLYADTSATLAVKVGDRVDVIGFPEFIQRAPALADAVYRRIDSAALPVAQDVTPASVLDPEHDSGLVRIEARLTQLALAPDVQELTLESGKQVFQVMLDGADDGGRMAALEPDSILRVTGVCIQFRDSDGDVYGFKLRVRTPADIVVVRLPPWWNLRRALMLLVLMTAVSVIAASGWVVALRRRVRIQTDTLEREQQSKAVIERRYFELVEQARDIICTFDVDGVVQSINLAGEAVLGYPRHDIVGQNISQMTAPELRARLVAVLGLVREGADPPAAEWEIVAADGRRVPLEVSLRVIKVDQTPVGVEAIARDITERRRAEAERLALSEQLRQSQKMEAIGRLAGGVAHDFNNLLTVINGYSDMILGDIGGDDERRGDVEVIRDAATRASALTAQLLAFSRRQILQPKVMDLNDAIADATKLLRRLIGEDVVLTVRNAASPAWIKADPGQVQQVIMNLAVNARDAMPGGGTLTIGTGHADRSGSVHEVGGRPTDSYVALTVADTGAGIDDTTRARLYEPFFTTKEPGKGTGLGLSTVYGIVEQSGGFITLESEVGTGTTFTVCFPAVAEQDSGPTVAPAEGTWAARRNNVETILVVEDEHSVRHLMARALREQGYVVLEASSGREALEAARAGAQRIDLLLSDVVMPEMSGKALASYLVAERPDLRTLFVSGYTDDDVIRHGVENSRVAFLQKPFTMGALLAKVRDVVDAP